MIPYVSTRSIIREEDADELRERIHRIMNQHRKGNITSSSSEELHLALRNLRQLTGDPVTVFYQPHPDVIGVL